MAKILITGGAGFIGSQLGLLLVKEGDDVQLLDNMSDGYIDNILLDGAPFTKIKIKDVRDPELRDEIQGVETIFHFAGTSSLPKCQANPAQAYDNNVNGLINVLEWGRKCKVKRVIFSSTSATYENNTKVPFHESDVVSPNLVYSASKLAGEDICKAYAATYNMDIIIARFFNVYGEHQDIHRTMPPFISYLAKESFLNRQPVIYNQSDAVRDYIYVEDVVRALRLMKNSSEKFKGDIFNLCTGMGYSVKNIISMYAQVAKKTIAPIYADPVTYWDKFPGLFEGLPLDRDRILKEVYKNSIGSPTKVKNVFDFEAKINFADGLKRVHDYSIENLKTS